MVLNLSLKKIWFDLTKSEVKKEDYREITPYWCNRLLLVNGNTKSKKWWYFNFFESRSIEKTIASLKNDSLKFKHFDFNKMTLGYPSNHDKSKILFFEHKGIEVRKGIAEWGAEKDKYYFVIKHGNKIKN